MLLRSWNPHFNRRDRTQIRLSSKVHVEAVKSTISTVAGDGAGRRAENRVLAARRISRAHVTLPQWHFPGEKVSPCPTHAGRKSNPQNTNPHSVHTHTKTRSSPLPPQKTPDYPPQTFQIYHAPTATLQPLSCQARRSSLIFDADWLTLAGNHVLVWQWFIAGVLRAHYIILHHPEAMTVSFWQDTEGMTTLKCTVTGLHGRYQAWMFSFLKATITHSSAKTKSNHPNFIPPFGVCVADP